MVYISNIQSPRCDMSDKAWEPVKQQNKLDLKYANMV
jgi:hypothetical protein